ncbi:MAG: hypothetical protein AAGF47_06660 [Planctomycetota bacterium]
MRPLAAILFLPLVVAACPMSGCSTPRAEGGRLSVPAGGYQLAFESAAEAVVDAGYTLERIDASAGVITSKPRPSALLRREFTTLRVEFVPLAVFGRMPADRSRSQIEPPPAGSVDDEPASVGPRSAVPLVAQVTAVRTRLYSPVLRPEPLDARFSSRARDPLLERRVGGSSIEQVVTRDESEEARVAGMIGDRVRRLSENH